MTSDKKDVVDRGTVRFRLGEIKLKHFSDEANAEFQTTLLEFSKTLYEESINIMGRHDANSVSDSDVKQVRKHLYRNPKSRKLTFGELVTKEGLIPIGIGFFSISISLFAEASVNTECGEMACVCSAVRQ
jgi:hypothetical protein